MHARFYAPDADVTGALIALPDEEAEHLSRVLRLGAGAAIQVFDGRGREFEAVVESVTKSQARVRVGDAVASAPELPIALTLAQAVLKGDKMDDIVRDAVMLGAVAIQPLLTSRAEVSAATLERGRRRELWQRFAIASVKQCGRAVMPTVHEPRSLDDVLQASRAGSPPGLAVMLVEPGAAPQAIAMRDLGGDAPPQVMLLIGPEGGWSPQEIAAASPGCQMVTIGGITFRADAAPSIAIAALLARWRVF
jgi:16S rRNA (uracil1498-N3)-methyltransferase